MPIKPVKLGAILLETSVASRSIIIIGRMPVIDSRPPEFAGVSDLMMNLAGKWVDNMMKDSPDRDLSDVFEALAQRWK
jgi:hypothetical protein